ncbi:MAG: HEAT repeat domain-containing protein [Gemmataceae bacterium]|nr:HEAT repeat domain-containing protein [Gemmataceae bacterium]
MYRKIVIYCRTPFVLYLISILVVFFYHESGDENNPIKQLIKIVDDPSQPLDTRIEAAYLIGKLGVSAKEAIPHLITVLRRLQGRELEPLQIAIIDSLAQMGYTARIALPALTMASGRSIDIDLAIKRATKAILSTTDEHDVTSLVKQLGSSDPSQRLRAVDALRRLGDEAKEASSALMELLDDADYTVRNAAIEALLTISRDRKIPDAIIRAIAKELNESDPLRRLLALYRLGKIGSPSAIVADEVDKLRNDTDTNVRRVAQEILNKILTTEKK